MAVTTLNMSVFKAVHYKNSTQLWLGMGGPASWDNESVPPVPPQNTISIISPKFFVRANYVSLVADGGHDVVVRGHSYQFVSDDEAYLKSARFIYARFVFSIPTDFGAIQIRQIGVYANIIPYPQYSTLTFLIPSQISNSGELHTIENRSPVELLPQNEQIVHVVLEV